MIILITKYEKDEYGKQHLIVDRAVDERGNTVIVPCDDPRNLGAVFDPGIGEWVIK